MNAGGGVVTRLTVDPAADVAPAWSPDGRRIAFVFYRGGNVDLYLMNRDGSGLTRVTTNPAGDWDPSWRAR